MKRFRFTLLAVCLVLLYLGWTDASLFLRNRDPLRISIQNLIEQDAPREWLDISGGYLNLEQAISTSGTIELDALLVPLTPTPGETSFKVLVEVRDPKILDFFEHYHFGIDSVVAKERFLEEHRGEFHPQRDVTGMEITGLIASGNRDKLLQLAKETGMNVSEDVLFVSEGKEPSKFRGFIFLAVGILGLAKLVFRWKTPAVADETTTSPES